MLKRWVVREYLAGQDGLMGNPKGSAYKTLDVMAATREEARTEAKRVYPNLGAGRHVTIVRAR